MGGGEVGNAFHYVDGSLLQARDPQGLWTFRELVHAIETSGDAMDTLDERAPSRARAARVVAAVGVATLSLAPGVGEALDAADVTNPDLPTRDRAVAGASLGASALTEGLAPNVGGITRAARLLRSERRTARAAGRGTSEAAETSARALPSSTSAAPSTGAAVPPNAAGSPPTTAAASGPPAAPAPSSGGSPPGAGGTATPSGGGPSGAAGGAAGGGGGDARFVGQPDGQLVDTHSTPRGSYEQPGGGRTDILQAEDHGAGLSHTHDPIVNTNPRTRQTFVHGREQPGRPVSAEDVQNIESGAAPRSPARGR